MEFWAIGIGVVAVAAFILWRRRSKSKGDDIYAIVLMIETPRLLRPDIVLPAIESATGAPIPTESLVEERTSYFRTTVEGYEITIASAPQPYVSEKRWKGDARLFEEAKLAQGTILLDIWNAPEGKAKEDGLPLLGRIAAELMDAETRLVYMWPHQRVNVANEKLRSRYAAGEAVEAMMSANYDPVAQISGNRSVEQAVEEARNRWPEFANAFAARTGAEEETFMAKFRFAIPGDAENGEHMWIDVRSIDEDIVSGELMNAPVHIPGLRNGDHVNRPLEDLSDWLYVGPNGPEGGFVERVLRGGK